MLGDAPPLGRRPPVVPVARTARVGRAAARRQDSNLAGGGRAHDAPQPRVDLVRGPPGRLGARRERIHESGLDHHLPAEDRLEDRPDLGELVGVSGAQEIGLAERGQHRGHHRRRVRVARRLLLERERVADLHDPAPVDAADPHVLVDLVVDLPYLRGLGDDAVGVVGLRQERVELPGLGLQRGIGIELERHGGARVVPHVGEIDHAPLVGDPHLVEDGVGRDRVEGLDEPRRVVPRRLLGRDEMRGDTGLRSHLTVQHRVQGARHRGQRDRSHRRCIQVTVKPNRNAGRRPPAADRARRLHIL